MMIKKCALCSVEFTCEANDIANCQCSQISISEKIVKELKEKFTDCLCFSCLSNYSVEKRLKNFSLTSHQKQNIIKN